MKGEGPPVIYTMIDGCVLTAYCRDCQKEHTGQFGVRLTVIGAEPGFEMATCDPGDGGAAHVFAIVKLSALAGVIAQRVTRPPTNPEKN